MTYEPEVHEIGRIRTPAGRRLALRNSAMAATGSRDTREVRAVLDRVLAGHDLTSDGETANRLARAVLELKRLQRKD